MRILLAIAAVVALGCSASLGPARVEFWRGFNIEIDFPTRLCVGCLQIEEEEGASPPTSDPRNPTQSPMDPPGLRGPTADPVEAAGRFPESVANGFKHHSPDV